VRVLPANKGYFASVKSGCALGEVFASLTASSIYCARLISFFAPVMGSCSQRLGDVMIYQGFFKAEQCLF
jgi:hypothetical protein